MTNYYYLASDKKMGLGNGSIEFTESEESGISGFDYPIQLEIYNGIEKERAARELFQYIQNHAAPYKSCVVQVAHLINGTNVELNVEKKYKLLLHEIIDAKQLLLQEGHLLTIEKV